jgi:hypothetical protein
MEPKVCHFKRVFSLFFVAVTNAQGWVYYKEKKFIYFTVWVAESPRFGSPHLFSFWWDPSDYIRIWRIAL